MLVGMVKLGKVSQINPTEWPSYNNKLDREKYTSRVRVVLIFVTFKIELYITVIVSSM